MTTSESEPIGSITNRNGIERRGAFTSLEALLVELVTVGAHRIHVVVEDETGYRYLENGEMCLEVEAIYGHWDIEELLRRFLGTRDSIRWDGTDWDFDARVRTHGSTTRSVTVYNRDAEQNAGNGIELTRLRHVESGTDTTA